MTWTYYKSQVIRKIHVNLGLGIGELWGCIGPSFWIQWRSPFLWSWQIGFWTKFRVPLQASEVSNCSSTFTMCQNSGLLSGCKDQHCSIKAAMAGGQSPGIAGLKFWKRGKKIQWHNYWPHKQIIKNASRDEDIEMVPAHLISHV